MVAVAAMVCSSSLASANTSWEGVMPSDNAVTTYYETLYSSAVDPTGNVELGFGATLDTFNTVDGSNSYHEVSIGTTLFANTYGKTGYSYYSVGTGPELLPPYPTSVTLGEEEGVMIQFPQWGGENTYFRFYGKAYNQVFVCANGFIVFGGPDIPVGSKTTDLMYTNPVGGISDPGLPNGVVAPYWTDMKGTVTVKYGMYLTNHLIIWWDRATTTGGKVQTFGVDLWVTMYPDEEFSVQTPHIQFFYKEITLEYSYSSRKDRIWYPTFEMGVQNQFGSKYLKLIDYAGAIGPRNTVVYDKKMNILASVGNLYDIDRVNVYFIKTMSDGTTTMHDGFASIHVTGQDNEIWGGSNINSISNSPPENPYADYKNQVLASGIVTVVKIGVGAIPGAGAVMAAGGFLYDTYQLCQKYKAAERSAQTVADDAETWEDGGMASNVAKDGVTNVMGQASDVWSAPLLKWRLTSTDLTALFNYAHYLTVVAEVVFENENNNEQTPIAVEGLTFKFDHNKVQLFKEDFNGGFLSSWGMSYSGTLGQAALATTMSDTGAMKENFGDYSLGDWTVDRSGGDVYVDKAISGTPSGAPALQVTKTSTQGGASAFRMFTHQSSHFVARLVFRTPTLVSGDASLLLRQGSTDRIHLSINNGWLSYRDNSGWHTISTVGTGWCSLTLSIWPTNGNYSIQGGTVFIQSAGMLGSAPWTNNWIDTIGFRAEARNVKMHADDIWIGPDSSLLVYYPDPTNKVRLTSPSIGINRGKDYMATMNYYCGAVGTNYYMVIFDDGKVELVNKLNTATGKSALYANTANGLILISDFASTSVWHRIVIKVHPSTNNYLVMLDEAWGDDGGKGPYAMKSGDPAGYSFSLGSKGTPLSGESGWAYWDDLVVGEPYPSVGPPVNQPPVALFTATPAGLRVDVDATASYDPDGVIVTYQWAWGDAAVTYGVKSSHTYSSSGPHTIWLTVTDSLGAQATASTTVQTEEDTIGPTTSIALVGQSYHGKWLLGVYADITATDPSPGSGVASIWYRVGDTGSFNPGGTHVIYEFPSVGKYTIYAYAIDGAGNVGATVSKTVTVVDSIPV